jgi:stage II sporulation protein D
VRVGLHWDRGEAELSAPDGLTVGVPGGRTLELPGDFRLRLAVRSGSAPRVVVREAAGATLLDEAGPLHVRAHGEAGLRVGERLVRGTLELSARADSLFVVNVVHLEDYLRGVVPKEIGPRPVEEISAVSAQAVAARTYTVQKLGQYGSLPFDLFASVQDQVYEGMAVENGVTDSAIRDTRGLVLADRDGLIDAYYSSTCGGKRSDITAVWPHREAHACLRGGPDGSPGHEWCRHSPHFTWRETWSGTELTELVRRHLPAEVGAAAGSVRGAVEDVRVTNRGRSGRAKEIAYRVGGKTWRVPGDRNRWVLRRPGGGILRSVLIDLDVERAGGKVVRLTARGRGNGHGVGLCQMGAIGRARAGEGFRDILKAYYPGARLRPIRGEDLPPGRSAAL